MVADGCQPIGQAEVNLVLDGTEHANVALTILPETAMTDNDILLGQDMLKRDFTAVVSDKEVYVVENEALEELSKVLPKKSRVELRAKEEVILQPRTIAFVQAETVGHEEGMILIDDHDNCEALYDPQNKMLVPMANTADVEITLEEVSLVRIPKMNRLRVKVFIQNSMAGEIGAHKKWTGTSGDPTIEVDRTSGFTVLKSSPSLRLALNEFRPTELSQYRADKSVS